MDRFIHEYIFFFSFLLLIYTQKKKFCVIVWFQHWIVPSCFCCYKLVFSMLFLILQGFPKKVLLINLKISLQSHFCIFFLAFSFVFRSIYDFNQISCLNLMIQWLFEVLIHDLVLALNFNVLFSHACFSTF